MGTKLTPFLRSQRPGHPWVLSHILSLSHWSMAHKTSLGRKKKTLYRALLKGAFPQESKISSSTPISSFQCFRTLVLHDHFARCGNNEHLPWTLQFTKRFYSHSPIWPLWQYNKFTLETWELRPWVSSVPRAPIDSEWWSQGWNACLQTPEVTIHLTASHWLRSVYNF